jgi:hypothetical protein
MNCRAVRQVRCSTLYKITCTQNAFNILFFDIIRLHRNEVINYNNVVNNVLVVLSDDW